MQISLGFVTTEPHCPKHCRVSQFLETALMLDPLGFVERIQWVDLAYLAERHRAPRTLPCRSILKIRERHYIAAYSQPSGLVPNPVVKLLVYPRNAIEKRRDRSIP
jgi:hypothetical protein